MKLDIFLIFLIFLSLLFSVFILNSVSPSIFPSYYWYFLISICAFLFFSFFDFEILSTFGGFFYCISVVLLLITLIIGQITRGTVRWIPIGSFSFQPSEIVKPLLLIFFARYITEKKLDFKRIIKSIILMAIPLLLILVQPSLGVSILTAVGFFGIFLSADINKKNILFLILVVFCVIPISFIFLAPYQKQRITSFLEPSKDPLGQGYNAIQSMISVGSGKLFGRGLGRGVGTQLLFLPERQTDFIFASVSEELGFLGASILLILSTFILFRIISYTEKAISISARAFLSGIFLMLFAQIMIHVGMNMGLFPITGVPYPLISVGGSSLIATMSTLGIVVGTKK